MGLLSSNAKDWYPETFGRDADPQGAAYWNSRLAAPGADQTAIHDEFTTSGVANGETLGQKQSAASATGNPMPAQVADVAPIQMIHTAAPAAVTSTGYNATDATAGTATSSNASAVNALANGYASKSTDVAPEATSAYQLSKITGADSDLNKQSETYGLQQANKRGLLNSSIAVGAAHDAVLHNATPLAINDANTFARAGEASAAAENSARQFGAAAGNTAELNNSQVGTSVNLKNSEEANKASALNAQLGTNVSLSNAAANNSASQFGATASNNAAIATADNALKTSLADIQANTSLSIAQKQLESQRAIASAQNATNIAISNGDNATKMLLDRVDNASKLTLTNIDAQTKMALGSLDANTKTQLANIDATNRQLLQANVNAANMYQQYTIALANIQTNDKMDATAKQTAITTQINSLRAGLQAIGEVSGLDLSKYFVTDSISTAPPPAPPTETPAIPITPENPFSGG